MYVYIHIYFSVYKCVYLSMYVNVYIHVYVVCEHEYNLKCFISLVSFLKIKVKYQQKYFNCYKIVNCIHGREIASQRVHA